jgi:hypothetical protein
MCTVLLPPGVNPIVVNRYVNISMIFQLKAITGLDSVNSLMELEGDLNSEQENALGTVTFVTVRMKILFI